VGQGRIRTNNALMKKGKTPWMTGVWREHGLPLSTNVLSLLREDQKKSENFFGGKKRMDSGREKADTWSGRPPRGKGKSKGTLTQEFTFCTI